MHIPLNDLQRRNAILKKELRQAIDQVIDSGHYILGPWTQRFETDFSLYCGMRHAIGVASGTDALKLALNALGCGPGDDVVTVANAGGYATAAILYTGAKPVYADINPHNFLMTADTFLQALSPATKAVIVTHLYGLMVDMPAICAAAASRGIAIIEDCAQAHGASMQGKKAGSWGELGCFSFYPTKNLGGIGDAGIVVTNNAAYDERLRSLRQYGWRDAKYRSPEDVGHNSRMDEVQAAVLVQLLPHVDTWNRRRRLIIDRYRSALSPLQIAFQHVENEENFVAHLCVICTNGRDSLIQTLNGSGITTAIHYPVADYLQPAVIRRIGRHPTLPVTERLTSEILSLPCFPEMTEKEIDYVITSIHSLLVS